MTQTIALTLTPDEAEIIVDALDADLEGYVEAAKDARANGNRGEVQTFQDAAARITAVRDRIRALLD